jgi:hypothetical protein
LILRLTKMESEGITLFFTRQTIRGPFPACLWCSGLLVGVSGFRSWVSGFRLRHAVRLGSLVQRHYCKLNLVNKRTSVPRTRQDCARCFLTHRSVQRTSSVAQNSFPEMPRPESRHGTQHWRRSMRVSIHNIPPVAVFGETITSYATSLWCPIR